MEKHRIDTTSYDALLGSLRNSFESCADVIIQTCPTQDETVRSVILLYCEGLVDSKQINQFIIPRLEKHTLIVEEAVPEELGLTLKPIDDISDLQHINMLLFSGQLLLVFDNGVQACSLDIANIPGRTPEESSIETSVKGPRDGFTEELSTNIALVRKRLKTSSMCYEKIIKGERTQTTIGLLYVKDIINPEILETARSNLNQIDVDGIMGTSIMERAVMGAYEVFFPLTDNSERPDYVADSLINGRFAVLTDGSPVAIIAPTTLFNQLKSPEDENTPFFIVTFERILRITGLLIACFFPAFYIGLTSFNLEQIPLPLLATIAGTRMGLPMPVTLEAFLMIFMFELFNEAGRRLPRALGQTVSVVGGLIIGDAAIRAGITSPTIIVTVAISVISSYILVNTVLGGATSQVRIGMLIASSVLGLFGFMVALFALLVHLVSLECYGVSYLSPVSPYIPGDFTQAVSMPPSMTRTERPAALRTQDSTRHKEKTLMRWACVCSMLAIGVILLTGCWDSKEVQSINFITAIGIDYADNQYTTYAQLIDFSSIAKQEGPTPREGSKIWIGRGTGSTLSMAINNLYQTSQQQTLWTHVKAIVLSKNALESRLEDIFNTLLHSGQLRYTPWIYGTEQDMSSLLSPSAILNQSAQTIEFFEPMRLYRQFSGYEPIRLHQLLDSLREPASVVLLPSVSTKNETWHDGEETPPLIRMDGFYVVSNGKSQGKVTGAEADGTRYVNYDHVYQYPLYVYGKHGSGTAPDLTLNLHKPNTRIKAIKSAHGITFDLVTSVKGTISEDHGSYRSPRAMEQEASKQMEAQIRSTFAKTKARNIDSYGLVEHLYRHHPDWWKEEVAQRAEPLARFQLGKVEVHVRILNASTYKYGE